MTVVRVLVAASTPVARAGLEALVARRPGLALVGTAEPSADPAGDGGLADGGLADGGSALDDAVAATRPDVVLVELDPPGAVPGGSIPSLEEGGAAATVLLVDADVAWALAALRRGARAVLPRHATADEIAAAIEGAAAGLAVIRSDQLDAVLARTGVAALRGGLGGALGAPTAADPLTPREHQVLGLLAEGLGNKHIAARLGISEHTVKTHLASVFEKLGAETRADAVARGVRRGLIML